MPKTRSRRIAGFIARTALTLAIPVLIFVAWDQATYNFGQVQPGRIYRSGQIPAAALSRVLRTNGIKSVLNLRGSNPNDGWYRDEVAALQLSALLLAEWINKLQESPDAALRLIMDAYERTEADHGPQSG